MTKYIEHDKASKARRKDMVVIGTTTKEKAKAIVKQYPYRLAIYGTYLDGRVDVGLKIPKYGLYSMERIVNLYKTKVANA